MLLTSAFPRVVPRAGWRSALEASGGAAASGPATCRRLPAGDTPRQGEGSRPAQKVNKCYRGRSCPIIVHCRQVPPPPVRAVSGAVAMPSASGAGPHWARRGDGSFAASLLSNTTLDTCDLADGRHARGRGGGGPGPCVGPGRRRSLSPRGSWRGQPLTPSFCCSDGAGRSGTYVLIDMVLNKMAKGEWAAAGAGPGSGAARGGRLGLPLPPGCSWRGGARKRAVPRALGTPRPPARASAPPPRQPATDHLSCGDAGPQLPLRSQAEAPWGHICRADRADATAQDGCCGPPPQVHPSTLRVPLPQVRPTCSADLPRCCPLTKVCPHAHCGSPPPRCSPNPRSVLKRTPRAADVNAYAHVSIQNTLSAPDTASGRCSCARCLQSPRRLGQPAPRRGLGLSAPTVSVAGAKEIDIAATLEHLRDQRPGMVQTKEQFEFALTAVAEEVNAILKALPQ
ncbi:Receptor-type tyrosine-protein phosphatase N2 [Galemys pyrenaicus]|uniref:Receptor-type tyrosine-protein phosphatase N2 n=1 Tax=Galemys pyrenaicus TaxID=202257 RepID=A0A8J5ZW11_GALPY|nr:Receptor-type tyrosine-protein phosphatase N2 [Galemys pyrenaicus]